MYKFAGFAFILMYMYRKNKILLYIGSSAIPLANARGSENFGSF